MRSKIDLMVLGLLSERPMHGYEIHQVLASDIMKQWVDIGFTSIYHSLSRLKKQGLIVETVDTGSNKQKNVYHLTTSGREEFLEDLRIALAEQEKLILEYNIPLFFINKLNTSEALAGLKVRETFLRSWLNTLDKTCERADVCPPTVKMIIDHSRAIATREVEWLKELCNFIEETPDRLKDGPGDGFSLMGLHGSLKDKAVGDVVHLISAGNRTGTLKVESDDHTVKIGFDAGRAVFASSSVFYGDFDKKPKVGTAESVEGSLALLILNDVFDAFNWNDGDFSFQPDVIESEKGVSVSLEAHQLILEGCRRVDDWDKIRAIIPSDETIFDLNDVTDSFISSLNLNDRERVIVKLLNGVRDVNDLAELCNLSVYETSKTLYALNIVGLTTIIGPDKAEALKAIKQFSRMLLERVFTIGGDNVIGRIEAEVNLALSDKCPFMISKGTVKEDLQPGTGLDELIDYGNMFLSSFMQVIAKHVGKGFTQNLADTVIKRLPPKMVEDFKRYGLNKPGLEVSSAT